MTDEEAIEGMVQDRIKFYDLERLFAPDYTRAVKIRRKFVERYINEAKNETNLENREEKANCIEQIPVDNFDYSKVVGSNCENVIGYVPIPIGFAGPILIDGKHYGIPMATTEGALVASTHRGARVISRSGGCTAYLVDDGMTRAPVVELPNLARAVELEAWVSRNTDKLKVWFSETTRFGKLISVYCRIAGRKVHMRFRASTGDAMGMNMLSKGTEHVLQKIKEEAFPEMRTLSLSGNFCTDKKPSAVNWVEGRGKGVVAEAVVKKDLVEKVLKTDVKSLVQLNIDKNLIGSAMAGSIGGFNAQAANVVAAIFLASGQDPAQVVESATALTMMEEDELGNLRISVNMPSIEVGTIGGGTTLPAQHAVLGVLGCAGANAEEPGKNATTLARVVACSVLSAELSLMAGLSAGHLVRAHMALNRK